MTSSAIVAAIIISLIHIFLDFALHAAMLESFFRAHLGSGVMFVVSLQIAACQNRVSCESCFKMLEMTNIKYELLT